MSKQDKKKGQLPVEPVATIGYKDKPLGEWPDTEKHENTEPLEEKDSESIAGGHQPETGSDEPGKAEDVDEITESMGIYDDTNPDPKNPESGPENPAEVDIAKEIEKNNEG